MKRITFIIGGMTRGGAERVISNLANEYSSKGCKLDIILLLNNKIEYDLNSNIDLFDLSKNRKYRMLNIFHWIRGIRKYITSNSPDIIISFVARINILALLSSIGLSKKIIISERNDPNKDGRSFIVKILTKILYPMANAIVFQTQKAKKCFSEKIQKKGIIISNPILISQEASNIKSKKIVNVGRLSKQKNQRMLIDAFIEAVGQDEKYQLFIYGEGELRSYLEEYIIYNGMQDRIFLPGNIKDIHQEISDAEIFVLSSDYEGLSNALLEAMCMGITCISTKCAGAEEYIIDGENGILIDINNKQQLIDKIKFLIKNPETSKAIAKQGMKCKEVCSSKVVFEKWDKLIEELVNDYE